MGELKAGDKVVYGTFVGTVRQLVGDDECVILLRAPMSDGAVTIIAKVEKCEVVTAYPSEVVEETTPEPESVPEPEPEPETPPEPEIPAEVPAETPSEVPAAAAEEPPETTEEKSTTREVA